MSGKRTVLLLGLIAALVLAVRSRPQRAVAETAEVNKAYLPMIQTFFSNNLFGVHIYGQTTKGSPNHDALLGSRAMWVRAEVNWFYVEPENTTPENYDWRGIDRELAAARADHGGYNVIATVMGAPSWASSSGNGQGRIDLVSLSEFTEFVGALVERYDADGIDDAPGRPLVRYWEFYNEPDHFTTWGTYPEEYAEMLAAVYPVVHSASRTAQVVFGGVAYDWFQSQGGPFVENFLANVFASPGGDQFDIMNYHTYAAFYLNWSTRGVGLLEKAQAVRQLMADSGLSPRPMVVTEAGWCSTACTPSLPTSEANQARYVVALLTQGLAADLDVMTWWVLRDLGSYAGNLYAFGLVTNDNPPLKKQSYFAYRTAVTKLKPARFEKAWSNGETGHTMVEFYEFYDQTCLCKRYVGWLDPLETSGTATVLVPHSQVKVYESVNGALIATLNDADDGVTDGKTRVTVTGAPRYFEGK